MKQIKRTPHGLLPIPGRNYSDPGKSSLSLVIPLYNETKRLDKTFRGISHQFTSKAFYIKEIIFVNDGSTDSTLHLVKQWRSLQTHSRLIKIISYSPNQGKGFAVKTGMLIATGDYALILDADMSTPLSQLVKFEPFVKKGIDVIIGTRKNGHSTVVIPQPLYRQLMGQAFTVLAQFMLQVWVSDFTCGFKLFSKSAYRSIFPKSKIYRWGYDAEIVFLAKTCGFQIQEKALKWYNDARSRVHVFQDTFKTLAELITIKYFHMTGQYAEPADHDTLVNRVTSWIIRTSRS